MEPHQSKRGDMNKQCVAAPLSPCGVLGWHSTFGELLTSSRDETLRWTSANCKMHLRERFLGFGGNLLMCLWLYYLLLMKDDPRTFLSFIKCSILRSFSWTKCFHLVFSLNVWCQKLCRSFSAYLQGGGGKSIAILRPSWNFTFFFLFLKTLI